MKLLTRTLSVILFVIAIGCNNDSDPQLPVDSCETEINNFQAALTVYNSDQTNRAKCIQAKQAGQILLDCPGLSPGQKSDYKNTIDAIFCP